MSALLKVEDTREPKFGLGIEVGKCTECECNNRAAEIYEEDEYITFEHEYIHLSCFSQMTDIEKAAWFGGEFKRGL